MRLRAGALAIALIGCGLAGCGTTVPDIKEVWDADTPPDSQGRVVPGAAQIEYEVKQRIYCDLEKVVKEINSSNNPVRSGPSPKKLARLAQYPIPPDFIAQMSLSFQVDESSALNPGVLLTTTLPNAVSTFGKSSTVTTGQSRSLGFGGTLSSTATRIDKYDPTFTIGYLMEPDHPDSICADRKNDPFRKKGWEPDVSSPFAIEGDLGIHDWLVGATIVNTLIQSNTVASGGGGGGGGGVKTDAISYEVKFVIVSSGNITPTWKLVQVSANTSGTFYSAGRTRTHDLIITIGPNDTRTLNAHLASEIGQAVSGGMPH